MLLLLALTFIPGPDINFAGTLSPSLYRISVLEIQLYSYYNDVQRRDL